jgi:hypothetical protein
MLQPERRRRQSVLDPHSSNQPMLLPLWLGGQRNVVGILYNGHRGENPIA